MIRARNVVFLMGVLLILCLSFTAGYVARRIAPQHDLSSPPAPDIAYGGKELVLVFLGAASCAPSNRPDLLGHFVAAQRHFERLAVKTHLQFAIIGVALDPDPREGYMYLSDIGGFTEISAGSNWHNSTAVRYLWIDHPGPPVTPQLVLLSREVHLRDDGSVAISDERVLVRRVGADAIGSWVKRGMPLPVSAANTTFGEVR